MSEETKLEVGRHWPDPYIVRPLGGKDLTPVEAGAALREALKIIEKVGTTGIDHEHSNAYIWLKKYFPAHV